MITASKVIYFEAGHRLIRHESKCRNVHGHNYKTIVFCTAPALDDVGRVVDFGVIKRVVGKWIDDNWDHGFLVNKDDDAMIEFLRREKQKHYVFDCEPTAENMAMHLKTKASQLMTSYHVDVYKVRIWETEFCYVEAS